MRLILKYTISKDEAGISLLTLLKKNDISKKTTIAIKHRGGKLLVNDEPKIVHHILSEGDQVTVIFPEESRSSGLIGYKMNLNIIFEDDYLLVIDKPSGIATIPSLRHPHKTLANGIIYYYDEQGIDSTIHFVNRLDRDTSGLLVVAKYRHIHHLLTQDIKQIKRKYVALVKGELLKQRDVINEPIAREKEGNVKRCVREGGQGSITHYHVLEKRNQATVVECELETGRTHQIRVHMSHLGHPLIGDTLYDEKAIELDGGHLLHSYKLSFKHPITKKDYFFETDIPESFCERKKND